MNNITEGMQANDLDFLVMPIVSVDEYESKIDDRRAVVIGFYVTDTDPAAELSSFIEKGTISVLDTEVSPAPTEDGYYLVFVEMDRNEKLPRNIIKLIDSVNRLTNVEKWQFSPYHSKEDENYPLTLDMLKSHLNCDPDSIEVRDEEAEDEMSEGIAGFLRSSLIEGFSIDGDVLTMKSGQFEKSYRISKFGEGEPDSAIMVPMIGESQLSDATRLQSLLGSSYQVYSSGEGFVLLGEGTHLVLAEID